MGPGDTEHGLDRGGATPASRHRMLAPYFLSTEESRQYAIVCALRRLMMLEGYHRG